ncbi:hypothetical protein XA68_14359 [Ophiocordyceps unilateralis]|uniref:Uncharacterized protein n=1 Tax=Ophiocordyceps unilateralis TaxID=268505 RepID=A0A2A9P9P8_OPHUN|nr:hypothetical protein XA68_14359 [Ophiocordyceps unilateralis]
MARATLPVLGSTLALLATSTVLCLQIITVVNTISAPLRPATAAAACLQLFVLAILWWLAVSRVLRNGKTISAKYPNLTLGLGLLACALAAAVSAAALIYLGNARADLNAAIGQFQGRLLAGTSVAVALATVLQLACIICHFMTSRQLVLGKQVTPEAHATNPRRRLRRIKSIPYSQTKSGDDEATQEMTSSIQPPSPVVTASPTGIFKSPFAQAVRPSPSKQKLIVNKKQRRPNSADSDPRRSSVEASSFDSWDTSSVDAHNRQVVLDMSGSPSSTPQGLETIPASPSHSRSSSARSPTDLGPPRSLRTSRSLSHSTLRHQEEARVTPASSVHELHIHPLFRSDSQEPPPLASPGTSVLASPIAGQVITRRESSKSLGGMIRSGSATGAQSPLAHQTCFESTESMAGDDSRQRDEPEPEPKPEPEPEDEDERRMTPPVPSWLLTQPNIESV